MLLGAAVVEEVLVPVLTAAVVCLARVVDAPLEEAAVEAGPEEALLDVLAPEEAAVVCEVSEAPVLVLVGAAAAELSVAEAPGAAWSFSRPAVMVTGSWNDRKSDAVPTLVTMVMLPVESVADIHMLHEATSAALESLQWPPSVLLGKH